MKANSSNLKRPIQAMPDFVRAELEARGLSDRYFQRPPYQRNDYLSWINRAVREKTKRKRLHKMLSELEAGDVYMGMKWNARQAKNPVLR